jgi:hypothetical protein
MTSVPGPFRPTPSSTESIEAPSSLRSALRANPATTSPRESLGVHYETQAPVESSGAMRERSRTDWTLDEDRIRRRLQSANRCQAGEPGADKAGDYKFRFSCGSVPSREPPLWLDDATNACDSVLVEFRLIQSRHHPFRAHVLLASRLVGAHAGVPFSRYTAQAPSSVTSVRS